MDALEKVESSVEQLLARLELLKKENSRLNDELALLAGDNAVLARENQSLQAALLQERNLRATAVERIDSLLAKLRNLAG